MDANDLIEDWEWEIRNDPKNIRSAIKAGIGKIEQRVRRFLIPKKHNHFNTNYGREREILVSLNTILEGALASVKQFQGDPPSIRVVVSRIFDEVLAPRTFANIEADLKRIEMFANASIHVSNTPVSYWPLQLKRSIVKNVDLPMAKRYCVEQLKKNLSGLKVAGGVNNCMKNACVEKYGENMNPDFDGELTKKLANVMEVERLTVINTFGADETEKMLNIVDRCLPTEK